MDCARDYADNLTDCSLKPGPKGDKGCLGDQGKEGPRGMNGEPGVRGYTGRRGKVGRMGTIGNSGPMGHRGVMGEIGPRGEAGIKGDSGMKGEKGMTGEQGARTPIPTIPSERCGGPGWRKVAFIDMTDTSQNCPQGLALTGYSKRSCGRIPTNECSCSSVTFPVGGGQYSRVCGRAKAYHWGYLYSFWGYHFASRGINSAYVDGLSFTHGTLRTHIWTFAAGFYQGISGDPGSIYYRCPCNPGNTYGSPPFVGNDYFCESGVSSSSAHTFNIYPDDPLWDGQGCIRGNPCCSLFNPPWFKKTLPTPTTDDIEMRLCLTNGRPGANIALEQMELYVY